MQLDPSTVPPQQPAQLRSAALPRRIASVIYEAVLLVPVLFVSSYLFLSLTQAAQGALKRPLFQLWEVTVLAIYFIYCWMHGGQTLAMKTWRVRLARSDGTPILLRQALARFLVALWGALLFGVGFWWALIDRDRQFLHDRLCGTRLFDHKLQPQTPAAPPLQ